MAVRPTPPDASATRPRSLADDLRLRDDEQLAALLASRPDLVHPVPADLGSLVVRATTPASLGRALDRLDAGTLGIAEGLAALNDPGALDALVEGLPGVPAEVIDAAIHRLWTDALVWVDDLGDLTTGLHLVRGVRDAFGTYPGGLGPSYIAQRRLVAGYAGDPKRLDSVLSQASPEARNALAALLWGPPIGRVRHPVRPEDPADARTPIQWLLSHDLLVVSDTETVTLPREVGLHLRRGVLVREVAWEAPSLTMAAAREPALVDRTAGQHAFGFVRLVEDLLEAWSTAPPAVMRAGGLTVRDLTRAATILDVDERTAALVVEIAYAAGLVAPDGEIEETWVPTPAYDGWLARDLPSRWAVLVMAWWETSRAPGLVGAKDDGGARVNALSKDVERPAVLDVRHECIDLLASLEPGRCPSHDDVLDVLHWRRPRRRSSLRDSWTREILREAEALGMTGLGALSTHGRELHSALAVPSTPAGGSRERGPDRIAVPRGAVDAVGAVLPELVDHVLLQADLTAVAPGPLTSDLSREMALLADVESTGAATVYRFSESSVRRALDAGRTAPDILGLLEQRSRTPVPQPLRYLVDDVARRHGTIRVGVATTYLRCNDETLVSGLLADRRVAALGLSRVAPTVLASHAPIDVVLASLRAAGHAPMGETTDGGLVVRRPDSRRSPERPRPARSGGEPAAPGATLLSAAVRALRAGDRAVASRPTSSSATGASTPVATSAGEVVAHLRAALEAGRAVWIGYADVSGSATERVVEPLRLEAGFLTAFDLRSEEVRTFTVARITGVGAISDTP